MLGGLTALAAAAWAYVLYLAATSHDTMAGTAMAMAAPAPHPWTPAEVAFLAVMWGAMMTAMMLPAAAPTILLFGAVQRRRRADRRPYAPVSAFLLGYLVVWGSYGVAAALAQWALHSAGLLSPAMRSASPVLAGALLVAAGAYQWTPLKRACLGSCRSPLEFFAREWREGARGAVRMGARHGTFCVGCCGALMALLFVAGVMNLLWVAGLAGLVLVEKMAPGGAWLSRAAGLLPARWGAWLLAGGWA